MRPFVLTHAAEADLIAIARYTDKIWGIAQRNSYLKQFDDLFHTLGRNPQTGIACDALREGYRKFPLGSHMVYYRNGQEVAIVIVRILHKSMDAEARV
jgi:toxin ParE1/3/4